MEGDEVMLFHEHFHYLRLLFLMGFRSCKKKYCLLHCTGNRVGIDQPKISLPLALIVPCHVKWLANESECVVHSNKVFLITSAASYGCNQLPLCTYTHHRPHYRLEALCAWSTLFCICVEVISQHQLSLTCALIVTTFMSSFTWGCTLTSFIYC